MRHCEVPRLEEMIERYKTFENNGLHGMNAKQKRQYRCVPFYFQDCNGAKAITTKTAQSYSDGKHNGYIGIFTNAVRMTVMQSLQHADYGHVYDDAYPPLTTHDKMNEHINAEVSAVFRALESNSPIRHSTFLGGVVLRILTQSAHMTTLAAAALLSRYIYGTVIDRDFFSCVDTGIFAALGSDKYRKRYYAMAAELGKKLEDGDSVRDYGEHRKKTAYWPPRTLPTMMAQRSRDKKRKRTRSGDGDGAVIKDGDDGGGNIAFEAVYKSFAAARASLILDESHESMRSETHHLTHLFTCTGDLFEEIITRRNGEDAAAQSDFDCGSDDANSLHVAIVVLFSYIRDDGRFTKCGFYSHHTRIAQEIMAMYTRKAALSRQVRFNDAVKRGKNALLAFFTSRRTVFADPTAC
jgi:hypothetical protein